MKIFTPFIILIVLLFFLVHYESAYADSTPVPSIDATVPVLPESETLVKDDSLTKTATDAEVAEARPEKEPEEPPTLFYGYWKQGLYIKNPQKRFHLKIGGKVFVDAGYLDSGAEIQNAFPDFDGSVANFRKLSLAFSGSVWQKIDFKLEIDFANAQDIQDEWISFPTIPVLKYMTFGHIKEPFSLENVSSSNYSTFMEQGLTNEPFAPGRNIGMLLDNDAEEHRRLTWALGWFLNTGAYSTLGDSRDQIDRANGYDVSARLTGLPWYRDTGDHLLHLGLSYNYRDRDEAYSDSTVQFRARPESRLRNDRSIDTGTMLVDRVNIIDPEFAFVSGPFSLQGEFFYSWSKALTDDTYRFWGSYVYGSVFLTGEHRIYNPSKGSFSKVSPHENFEIFGLFAEVDPSQEFTPRHGLGAFELGARFSYMDLDDKDIHGGKESNLTLGVNWYVKSNARLMVNYIHARITDRADPVIEDDTSHIIQTRFQIYF